MIYEMPVEIWFNLRDIKLQSSNEFVDTDHWIADKYELYAVDESLEYECSEKALTAFLLTWL